ncbi:MAG TPA: hypothetical protein VFK32_01435, partial [Tepidiformaceae bacterium]|nr:hypothetical protein [Tepidiformaceae bacterium]
MDPALAIIALLLAGSFSLLGVYVVEALDRPSRVVRRRIARNDDPRPPGLALLRVHTSGLPIVERLPLSLEARERMFEELRLAGQPMRVSEYLALRLASALIVGFTGAIVALRFSSEPVALLVVALGAAVIGWMLPRAWLNGQRKKRQETIERQLGDALMSMAKALRAGAGLLQALAYAGDETPDPLGGELRAVLSELQLGADPDIVFSDLSRR